MDMLESKAFRTGLTIATVIVLFLVLKNCSSGESTGTEVRAEATQTAIDEATTTALETLTVSPSPVIAQVTGVPSEEVNELTVPIEAGDTLNEIAIRYNVSIDVIMRANPSLDASNLQIGQKIRVPGAALDPSALENPDTEREPGETVEYFIQDGDTLGGVANDYTVSLDALLQANPSVDAASLQVGQKVTVPPFGTGLDPTDLTPTVANTPIPREVGEALSVQVEAGDTLAGIASAYGVTLAQLMAVNDIADPNSIVVGQELLIPPPA